MYKINQRMLSGIVEDKPKIVVRNMLRYQRIVIRKKQEMLEYVTNAPEGPKTDLWPLCDFEHGHGTSVSHDIGSYFVSPFSDI